ncbi:Transcriptional activator RfaH [hydrothermal vent metagenome]|uniref:Transcriptional activator RfaH n=1 Tax=hydrothermal vent metagenome TaxID=652676 RepID=A0A3B1AXG4_9ZZZZ
MEHWYAIQTKPRQEVLAEENLRRQRFEAYLPRISLSRRRRGKWVKVIEPLFPRYLFIRFDPAQLSIGPIRSTRGVVSIVRFGNEICSMPDDAIEFLKQHEDSDTGLYNQADDQFQQGDSVTVISGAFAGLEGVFQAQTSNERVVLLIECLGRASRVTLGFDDVGKAPI